MFELVLNSVSARIRNTVSLVVPDANNLNWTSMISSYSIPSRWYSQHYKLGGTSNLENESIVQNQTERLVIICGRGKEGKPG